MEITSDLVRALRERTGAGLMECKRALGAAQGDLEGAVDYLRKSGLKTAEKKAERETGEGRVRVHVGPKSRVGSMVALTCETDFVAKTSDFEALLADLAAHVAEKDPKDVDALLVQPFRDGKSNVGETLKLLVGKIG